MYCKDLKTKSGSKSAGKKLNKIIQSSNLLYLSYTSFIKKKNISDCQAGFLKTLLGFVNLQCFLPLVLINCIM